MGKIIELRFSYLDLIAILIISGLVPLGIISAVTSFFVILFYFFILDLALYIYKNYTRHKYAIILNRIAKEAKRLDNEKRLRERVLRQTNKDI